MVDRYLALGCMSLYSPNMPIDSTIATFGVLNLGRLMSIFHYLFICPLYEHPRNQFLAGILRLLHDRPLSAQLCSLLAGTDVTITYQVAKFAKAAKKFRAKLDKS